MARCWIDFDEVKKCVTIEETMPLLGINGDNYRREGTSSLVGRCHLPDHNVHDPARRNDRQFRIDDKDGIQLFHCFSKDHPTDGSDTGAEAGGDVVEFVKRMLATDHEHVRFFFQDHFGDRLSGRKSGARKRTKKAREETVESSSSQASVKPPVKMTDQPKPLKALRWKYLDLEPDCDYLRDRGVSPEVARQFGMGLCRPNAKKRRALDGYIAIPVHGPKQTLDENPACYLGRLADGAAGDERPKYKWPADFPKRTILFGWQQALAAADERIIVVEGVFDLLRVVAAGFSSVVSPIGADLSHEQAQLLLETGRRVWLVFDGDECGQAAMRTAAGKLIKHVETRVVRLPEGKDPADLSIDELRPHLAVV